MVRQTPASYSDACVCLCLIRLSKNLDPAPGGTSERLPSACASEKRPENKKPGVERRARPSTQDGPARCSTVFLSGIRNQPHLVGLETGTPLPTTYARPATRKQYSKCYSRVKPPIPPFFLHSLCKFPPLWISLRATFASVAAAHAPLAGISHMVVAQGVPTCIPSGRHAPTGNDTAAHRALEPCGLFP
jgi:hypothetical protein